MEIDGYTRTCGVIGNPVEHTMSPAIHNTLAANLGENLVYVPFRVPAGHVGEAVQGAYALNLLGLNVTVPYKSEVIPFLKETDPLAQTIGAVNTLVRTEGGFKGYNTDMPGLYRAMSEDGVEIAGEKVLILGAGGVARAVAILAAEKKAAEILILNRTREKAARIAEEVNSLADRQLAGTLAKPLSSPSARPLAEPSARQLTEPSARPLARPLALEEYASLSAGKYLAIQATNVGMFPRTEEAVIEDAAFYEKIHTGYDLVFNPAQTKFMTLVQQSGGRAFGGLKMLLYQGIIAYELWTGAQVDQNLAEKAYAQMRKAMNIA